MDEQKKHKADSKSRFPAESKTAALRRRARVLQSIVRLARTNPRFCRALRTELRRAACRKVKGRLLTALAVGETKVVPTAKLQLHRYRGALVVTDLTNAGKRGKMVDEFSVVNLEYFEDPVAEQEFVDAVANSNSYAQALAKARAILDERRALPPPPRGRMRFYPDISERQLRGVRVIPPWLAKVEINGQYVSVEATPRAFTISDKVDTANEPKAVPPMQGALRASKSFYDWVRANQERVQGMKFRELLNELSRLGIDYHDYLAMD